MLWLTAHPLLAAFALGLLLELMLGEPKRWHPLVGFGRLANAIEQRLNTVRMGIVIGAIAYIVLVTIPILLFWRVQQSMHEWAWLFDAWALWFALGATSLFAHVRAIAQPLAAGDVSAARHALSHIVSRDCAELDDAGVAKGAIESALENGSDAIFSTLFWFALLGGVGVLLHRLSNTLDAMWGYRTARFNYFGRCAARCDDVLNFIPARLTALSYVLLAKNRRWAWRAWREQAPLHDSPNAGPVMAAGAGALGIMLGGAAVYHGQLEFRPDLGFGPAPCAADIERALALITKTLLLWIFLMSMLL